MVKNTGQPTSSNDVFKPRTKFKILVVMFCQGKAPESNSQSEMKFPWLDSEPIAF